ncbi:hypothetical protein F3Y22_tig00110384pilonHSYRG00169 [Hibiscus syriacus]|uniref:ABC transmembrane type-1 domain-containing protein n=1 Tax=Hibiscus syriacus TaxID=106335 RepID=A0A6A3AU91_HIBSY|nr:hypothetical protein F3Y22_tig00110384pilonHSYRG00169 [Hibiscus syriacus]
MKSFCAIEAVGNIRTVAAFCAEEKILDLYARELVEPSKRSFNRGQIVGIFYGISQFFILSSYGLGLLHGRNFGIGSGSSKRETNVEGTIELRGVQFSYPSRLDSHEAMEKIGLVKKTHGKKV